MNLDLNPGAIKNFNEKAEMLLRELIIRSTSQDSRKNRYNPEFYIASEITEDDLISDIRRSHFDNDGNEIGLFYLHEDIEIGLFKEGYINLIKLSQNIQKTKALNSVVSVSFIKDKIFEWLKYRYTGDISISIVDYS